MSRNLFLLLFFAGILTVSQVKWAGQDASIIGMTGQAQVGYAPNGEGETPHDCPNQQPLRIVDPATARTALEGDRFWDGLNPFQQPAATTDYYGSGDVNLDGELTAEDGSQAQEMAAGSRTPSYRADVDGNQVVDSNDVAQIQAALAGGVLPGWWNYLTSSAQRNDWIDKFLAADPTDLHPYLNWWVCGHFANQTFIHGALYRDDLSFSQYDGGQTWFNIPLYTAVPGFGHAINAILVGDDPLNFEDWRFIEPQNDGDARYEITGWVAILAPVNLNMGTNTQIVRFLVEDSSWSLLEYNPALVLTRPVPPDETPDNLIDRWNPRIVSTGKDMLLFDRSRDDLSHMTDIHAQDLPFNAAADIPLTQSSQYSRLLDVYRDSYGQIHLLWKGKEGYLPGIYHGIYDPSTRTLTDVSRVTTDERIAHEGRIVVTAGGVVHLFWLDMGSYAGYPNGRGIYWTYLHENAWQTPVNLTPGAGPIMSGTEGEIPNILYSVFDVAIKQNEEIDLVWAEPRDWQPDINAYVKHMRYTGSWGSPVVIATSASYTSYLLGVDLVYATDQTLHLVYWKGSSNNPWGDLIYQAFDGTNWSSPQALTSGGYSGFPRMTAGWNGQVVLVWMQKEPSRIVPAWSSHLDGVWGETQVLSIPTGTSAYYPGVELLVGGDFGFVWSSRSPDNVTIETQIVPQPKPSHITVTERVDSGPGTLRWALAAIADGGTIDFNIGGNKRITLGGELVVDRAVTVQGPGRDLIINGNQAGRIFEILPGGNLDISHMTLMNGMVHQAAGLTKLEGGGAFLNYGALTLDDLSIEYNEADYGGSISNYGMLTMTNSLVINSQASSGAGIHNSGTMIFEDGLITTNTTHGAGDGGGIYNDGGLTLNSVFIQHNVARGGGGLLNWDGGTVEMINTDISLNSAANGGGIENGGNGQLSMSASSVSHNNASWLGGGIANYQGGNLTIQQSSIVGNRALATTGEFFGGGGIYNFQGGEVTLRQTVMRENEAIFGAGIYNHQGVVILQEESEISDNRALGSTDVPNAAGGAIYNDTGVLTLNDCKILRNSASSPDRADGGGIYNLGGNLTIDRCTVSGNSASGLHNYHGGGIYNTGTLTLSRSTFSGNTVSGQSGANFAGGAGLYNNMGLVSAINCTISGNSGDEGTSGGGVFNLSGLVTITNCTISENFAPSSGGIAGSVRLQSTIIASNSSQDPSTHNCNGQIISQGYNLENENSCSLNQPTDLVQTNPLLASLGNYGGPTQTYALLSGSPAIDAANPAGCPATDQRGIQRPIDGDLDGIPVCDIGAFELGNWLIYLPVIDR